MLVTMLKRAAELDSGSEEAEEVSRNAAVMTYIGELPSKLHTKPSLGFLFFLLILSWKLYEQLGPTL